MTRNKLSEFDKRLRAEIAANLKRYTGQMTQGQLSSMTGIPTSTLSGYFAERSTPSAGNIQKIADALGIDKSDIDPRFSTFYSAENTEDDLPPLTYKDEREIARDLEKMLADMDDKNGMAAVGGTVDDAEDRELLKASLLTSMRLAKQIAKKKFTPKKYRKDDKE